MYVLACLNNMFVDIPSTEKIYSLLGINPVETNLSLDVQDEKLKLKIDLNYCEHTCKMYSSEIILE